MLTFETLPTPESVVPDVSPRPASDTQALLDSLHELSTLTSTELPNESVWGLPELETPEDVVEETTTVEGIPSVPPPPTCGRCRKVTETPRFIHPSQPDVALCVSCYNHVSREHRPPSKR